VSKSFYTKIYKKSKTDFFSISFLSRYWAFLGEGSSTTPPKQYQKKSDPGPFLASDPPTYHAGVTDLCFWRLAAPCLLQMARGPHIAYASASTVRSAFAFGGGSRRVCIGAGSRR
jgi:hypothetical protein